MIGLADVEAARKAIGDRLHRTPTFGSATLGELAGARVFLKAELFQKTGSFKPRGVLTNLAALSPEERQRGVIGISAGNHAQALAWGAAAEGIDALVVMWQGASQAKIDATHAFGAEVDLASAEPAEAFERLGELIEQTGRTPVHPFDHPLTIAGQGTVGLELLEDVPDADVVVVPVGGAGLISGIATAVKGKRPGARVVGVEPELSPALHEAMAAGKPVPVHARSIADGLGAPFAGTYGLEICRELVDDVVLVTEQEIEEGMRFLYSRAKLAVEPAGAATTAAILAAKIPHEPGETLVLVVSGGNVAAETAVAILGGR
ncbi:MAG: threonine/serine dehydratase [Actinomycetota bacterium]|nr:threonine/serine dehydratase [Actinomycetota bacterium]